MLQSILTASVYATVIVSGLYFIIGLALHLQHRFNNPRVAVATDNVIRTDEELPVIEPVTEQEAVQVSGVMQSLVEKLVADSFFGFESAEPEIDLHSMTFKELQQTCKGRYVSIRDGRRWLSKVELIGRLEALV